MVYVVSPQVLSQHMGRLFQSPKVIEGLIDILLHGQPAFEGKWIGVHCSHYETLLDTME